MDFWRIIWLQLLLLAWLHQGLVISHSGREMGMGISLGPCLSAEMPSREGGQWAGAGWAGPIGVFAPVLCVKSVKPSQVTCCSVLAAPE